MEWTSQTQNHSTLQLYLLPERATLFSSLEEKQLRSFKLSSALMFVIAYFYILAVFDSQTSYFFPVAIGLVSLVETLSFKLNSPFKAMEKVDGNRLEATIFLFLTLAQALALSIWGFHFQMEFSQYVVLHICFVFYVLSRTGWLSQGRLGIMVWFDSIQAFFILPFKYFASLIQVLFQKYPVKEEIPKEAPTSNRIKHFLFSLVSLTTASLLIQFVWSQLSQVSENFASITSNLGHLLDYFSNYLYSNIHFGQFIFYSILATPVSLYLFGLVSACLLRRKSPTPAYQQFQKKIQHFQVFPSYTAYIIIGSLCTIYALFFLTGMFELSHLLSTESISGRISPQDASSVAVSGFWQLVRVSMLNFFVLAGFYLVSKKPLWD